MLPIHVILHPTDFSDHSRGAFGVACALARDYGARLVLLHVAAPPAVVYGEWVVEARDEAYRRGLLDTLHQVQVPDPTIHTEYRLREGDPVTEVLDEAHESKADLIVMGTHGRTGLGRLLMGSVAEEVARRATCPVLTVRTPFPIAAPAAAPAEEAAAI
jgi:nucleotide-binding universal stress UspA family protein